MVLETFCSYCDMETVDLPLKSLEVGEVMSSSVLTSRSLRGTSGLSRAAGTDSCSVRIQCCSVRIALSHIQLLFQRIENAYSCSEHLLY